MNIAICDDISTDRNAIITLIHLYNNSINPKITQYKDAESLLQAYSQGKRYDVLFLDVEMNQINGIEAGVQIREQQPDILIVFVSNYPQYAIPAYDCNPLYFITKPINTERFHTVFTKVIEKYKALHQYYTIRNKGQFFKILIKDIYYIEIYRKHIIFHTQTEIFETTTTTLGETLETLAPHGFLQIHQGIIVNMEHIKNIQKYSITLDNDTQLMISVRKKSDVLKTYAQYIERTD